MVLLSFQELGGSFKNCLQSITEHQMLLYYMVAIIIIYKNINGNDS